MYYKGKDLSLREYFEAEVKNDGYKEVNSETEYNIIANYYSSCEYKNEDNEFLAEHGYVYTDFTNDGNYKFCEFQQSEEYLAADVIHVVDEDGIEIENWTDDSIGNLTVAGWQWTEPVGVGGKLEITVMKGE